MIHEFLRKGGQVLKVKQTSTLVKFFQNFLNRLTSKYRRRTFYNPNSYSENIELLNFTFSEKISGYQPQFDSDPSFYLMASTVPTKSQNDRRDYRVIHLKNGLTALLISDLSPVISEASDEDNYQLKGQGKDVANELDESSESEETETEESDDDEEAESDEDDECDMNNRESVKHGEKMAAAGLCINVGSFSDPDDIPGLAHLLEHMVFMGSKKYPNENSFDAFIKRHGGSDNASTDCERTVFQFEVHQKYFHQALNMFAQFFIHPLLKKDSMDREMESVDSEFQLSLPSDTFRKLQLLGQHAKEGHPMRKFMWGNLVTLKTIPLEKDIDVHNRLSKFRKRYYSAQYMTLAVQSRESLDTLERWITDIFSGIPNNGHPKPNFHHLTDPFDTPSFHKMYKVIPVKNFHQVEVTWALPSLLSHYKTKPLHYLSWLIGHEGKGSILSYLKKKVWALSLWCGNDESGFEHNSTYACFNISVGLTEEGLNHLFEVLTAIMEYIEMLRRVGPQERIYKEIQTIEDFEFRWQEELEPIENVENLCENMQLYPAEDYITGDQLMFLYDPEIITKCQNLLLPDKCNLVVTSKQFEKENICDKLEHWFQTPYQESDIDPMWLETWRNLTPNSAFHIPEVNKFIATDFDIKISDSPLNEYPLEILKNSQSRLWYKKDSKFNVPKAYIYFHLISPIVSTSPQSAVLLELFVNILGQNLKEEVYPADVAQLYYVIYDDDTGLVIQVHGFNHKLPILFETILNYIKDFDVTDELFDAIMNHLRKAYYNQFIKPSKLCKDVRLSILQQVHWTPVDKRAVMKDITKDNLLAFVKEFKSRLFIEGLVQGNITVKEALELDHMIKDKLKCADVPRNMIPEVRVLQLPEGERYCRIASFNKDDGNSVVTNYYQSGPANIHKSVLMELLIMFMEEPCFDILRTREQLGYNVYCMVRNTFGIFGFSVTVHTQADKYSCSYVDERIEAFLESFKTKLNQITANDFCIQVDSLIKLKQCLDLHLKEEVDRNWIEIMSGSYLFDRLQKEIECLKKITLSELKSWYHQHIESGEEFKKRKLGVQVVGTGKMQDGLVKTSKKRHLSQRTCTHFPDKTKTNSSKDLPKQTSKTGDEKNSTFGCAACLEELEDDYVYKLHFVSHPDSSKDELFINDIQAFKQVLYIYPVTKLVS